MLANGVILYRISYIVVYQMSFSIGLVTYKLSLAILTHIGSINYLYDKLCVWINTASCLQNGKFTNLFIYSRFSLHTSNCMVF